MNVTMACKIDNLLCANLSGLPISTSASNVSFHSNVLELCYRGVKTVRRIQGDCSCCVANLPMPSIQCWWPRPGTPMQSRPTR